jgi:hypothetical protein
MSNGNNNPGETKELSFTAKINETPANVANLLQQIAGNLDALTTLQFVIKVTQPAVADQDPPACVAIRQAFQDPQNNNALKVRMIFLPDGLHEEPVIDIRDDDIGERTDWRRVLNNPQNVDINTGICLVRLPKDAEAGVAVFIPNDGSANNTIVSPIVAVIPPGNGDTNLKAFLKCVKNQQRAMRKTYAQAFSECLHQL